MILPKTLPLLLLTMFSQDMANAQAPETVKAEIVTLSWQGNIKSLWFQGAKDPEQLDIYESGFAMPFEYTGPSAISFYKDKGVFDLPPEKRPPPAAVAKLPGNGGSVMLLFTVVPDDSGKWEVRSFDNSLRSFPPGSYRFFNLTDSPIQIAIDKTVNPPIASKSLAVIAPPSGETIRDVMLQIAVGKNIAYSSQWGHRDVRRATVFVASSTRGERRLEIRKFFQSVIPEPASASASSYTNPAFR